MDQNLQGSVDVNNAESYSSRDSSSSFKSKLKSLVPKAPQLIIMALAFLMPIIFLPLSVSNFQATKMFTFIVLTLLAFGFWIFTRLRKDSFELPSNLLTLSALLVPVIYLITAFFSPTVSVSIFGRGFELSTVIATALFFALLALVASCFKEANYALRLYGVVFISFLVVALFHLVRLISIDVFPSFGILFESADNTVGKWNDVAVFSGLILVLLLSTLEVLKTTKLFRGIQYAALVMAVLFLAIINFSLVWYLIGIFALLFFVYFLSVNRSKQESEKQFPVTPLVVLLVSFFFIISSNTFAPFVSGLFNVQNTEVRPSWNGTLQVLKGTLVNDPVVGVGPNRFSNAWQEYKPSAINQTEFWNINFTQSVGYIPTFLATAGIPGLLAWLFFFAMILISGFKALFRESVGQISKFVLISSFIATLYMWVLAITYIPSVATMILTILFTGVFIGSLYRENLLHTRTLDLKNNPKFGFIYVFALVVILVGVVALGFDATKRFTANVYFQRALVELNVNGNLDGTEQRVRQALAFSQNDSYFRSLAEVNRIRLNQIANATDGDQATLAAQFRNALSNAVASAQAAVNYDETNFNNHLALGQIYQSLIPLEVDGSYEQAKVSIERAFELSPKSPALVLELARLELANSNNDGGREKIAQALELKPDYTDAIFLLSQIDVSEGNVDQAIKNVEAAAVIRPNDPIVFFQLGLLRYSTEDFGAAIGSFERAVILNPLYANAKYFLGLSYDRVDRREDAIGQFKDLEILNPENEEVKFVLKNLEEGKAPFFGAEPPLNQAPEKREGLPLEEGADDGENDVPAGDAADTADTPADES